MGGVFVLFMKLWLRMSPMCSLVDRLRTTERALGIHDDEVHREHSTAAYH